MRVYHKYRALTRALPGQCAACVDQHSGQKKFNTTEIPSNIAIKETEELGDGAIRIHWRNDVQAAANAGHATMVQPTWLAAQRSLVAHRPTPEPTPWDRSRLENAFTKIPYDQYMHRREVYREALRQLEDYGLVVIENTPEDDKEVERVGEMIGPLRHTFYGRTWDVKDKPKAENVAYTSGYLGLHMDLL